MFSFKNYTNKSRLKNLRLSYNLLKKYFKLINMEIQMVELNFNCFQIVLFNKNKLNIMLKTLKLLFKLKIKNKIKQNLINYITQ
jgi:hypothetical protein